jgi:hypothetical protein
MRDDAGDDSRVRAIGPNMQCHQQFRHLQWGCGFDFDRICVQLATHSQSTMDVRRSCNVDTRLAQTWAQIPKYFCWLEGFSGIHGSKLEPRSNVEHIPIKFFFDLMKQ